MMELMNYIYEIKILFLFSFFLIVIKYLLILMAKLNYPHNVIRIRKGKANYDQVY